MAYENKKKILILENDPVVGTAFLEKVSKMGYEGFLVGSIVDADDLIASHDFHIAILDAHAPNSPSDPVLAKLGLKYAFQLRQQDSTLKIAVHTNLPDQRYIAYLQSNKIDYMQRPATHEQLEKILD